MIRFDWPVVKASVIPIVISLVTLLGVEHFWVAKTASLLSLTAWGPLLVYIVLSLVVGYWFKNTVIIRPYTANALLVLMVLLWTYHYNNKTVFFGGITNIKEMTYYTVTTCFILLGGALIFELRHYVERLKALLNLLLRK